MAKSKQKRLPKIKPINNFLMTAFLTLFQLVVSFCAANAGEAFEAKAMLAMGILIAVEWVYLIFFYTAMHRRNFELEIIAFFLCSVGVATIGSMNADSAIKQSLMIVAGVIVYIIMVFLMGNVDLCMKLRLPVAIGAILLLIVNLAIAEYTHGARNWIKIAGITFQPSEFRRQSVCFL